MFAQFLDGSKTIIVAVYASEQKLDYCYELDVSSDAYKTFYNAMPVDVQQSLPTPI